MESRTAEIVEAAVAYAERGWRILPVATTKKPLLRDWPNTATTDPERIRTWWKTSYRSAQVGICCGVGSNLVVLDVDPRHEGERGLVALADRLGPLPETITAATPSGGRHLCFAHPAGPPIGNRAGIAPGVDVRGEGGMVVAPPSVTDTGQYTWTAEPGTPLADLPLPWVEFLRPEPRPTCENAPAVNVASPAGIPGGALHGLTVEFLTAGADEGRRNDALFRAAIDMAGCGRSEHDATPDLLAACALCRPPLPRDEAMPTIRSAFAKPRTPFEVPEPDLDWEPPSDADGTPPPALAGMVHISNVEVVRGKEDERKYYAKPIDEIAGLLRQATGGWPRRTPLGLFVRKWDGSSKIPRPDDLWWLANENDLFAWMHEMATPYWPTIGGAKTHAYSRRTGRGARVVSRQEFFEHLRAKATPSYEGIELLPHEPAVDGLWYAGWEMPAGTGDALGEFAARYNAETDHDRALLVAATVTPGWGGQCGARPAFVFSSRHGRGAGKSRTAERIMSIWGGWVQLSPDDEDWTQAKSRLLADGAAGIRCVYVDNVRHKLSGADIEALITSPVIEGHKLYHGHAVRPNRMTTFITANVPRLSQDLASRAVPIQIGSPQHATDWEEWSAQFISDHRGQIIADCVWFLRQPDLCEIERGNLDRWSLWQRAVLRKFKAGNELASEIAARRPAADEDAEDANDFKEMIESAGFQQGIDMQTDAVRIAAADMRRLCIQTGLVPAKWDTRAVTGRLLNLTGDCGALHRLSKDPSRKSGRGWVYAAADGNRTKPHELVVVEQKGTTGDAWGTV